MNAPSAPGGEARLALGAGVSAYVIWGLVPLAFQVIGRMGVSALEILAHRTIWAVPTALVFVWIARQGSQALKVLRTRRTMAWLTLSAALIATNWLVFIWAVNSGRVLETSLGYYINPLLNIAAGALIFRERIDAVAKAAIALAIVGVGLQALALGHLPFVSLTLAISFCGYGIVRKRVAADAQTGLLVECLLLAVPSSLFVLWLIGRGDSVGAASPVAFLWLLACGPATALPLMLFAWAARRVPLSAMGFLQFIAPTMTFFMGVLQGEPFTPLRAASFVFIWGGALVFAVGAWRRSRAVLAAEKLVKVPAE
jgi:chloramphenicol-sensitive protein RarD